MSSLDNSNNNNNNNNYYCYNNKSTDADNYLSSSHSDSIEKKKCDIKQLIKNDNDENTKNNKIMSFVCTWLYSHLTLATFILFYTMIYLLFTHYFYITLLYYLWVYYDRQTCNRGGRRWDFVYRSIFWKYLANYFPISISLSNKFKLSPEKNYIVVSHPHGISAFGIVTTIATNGLGFEQNFPGMRSTFMVHETSFMLPILREVFQLRGDCSVNSKSFDYILSGKTGRNGHVICVIAGGLDEASLSDAKILNVKIANRKGFCRKALIHGASLIPSISFGENSVFDLVKYNRNSLYGKFEEFFYKTFGFKHPIYYGQCTFTSKFFGLMPYKNPITVAMGDPIDVEKCENPTQEQVDKLHTKYIEQLRKLYNSHSQLCHTYDKQMIVL